MPIARNVWTFVTAQFGNVTTETAFGQASSNGSAATLSRSDHTHGTPAAPATGATLGKAYAASKNALGV